MKQIEEEEYKSEIESSYLQVVFYIILCDGAYVKRAENVIYMETGNTRIDPRHVQLNALSPDSIEETDKLQSKLDLIVL